jgi:hypothetical protein
MSKRQWKDIWTLHLPLLAVLALCIFATINQYQRAQAGVDRSWSYMFQWPIIGVFAVVVWNRYRKHGNLTKWISRHYGNRIERFRIEAEAKERAEREAWEQDPDAQAWVDYQRRISEENQRRHE